MQVLDAADTMRARIDARVVRLCTGVTPGGAPRQTPASQLPALCSTLSIGLLMVHHPSVDTRLLPYPPALEAGSYDEDGLSRDDACLILGRNKVASIRQQLQDGSSRTHRVRYVLGTDAVFAESWTSLEIFYGGAEVRLELYVNEIVAATAWRCVRVRGRATPLQPTGPAAERELWRTGVTHFRRRFPGMPIVEELAFANFGMVRIELDDVYGSGVALR